LTVKTSSTPLTEAELLKEIASIVIKSDSPQSQKQIESLQKLARRHCAHGTSRSIPVREVLSMAGDKWTTLILEVLQSGTCRYSTLRHLVAVLSHERTISHRVLTTKLRLLERDGLLERRVRPSIPPRVDYELSQLGQALIEKIKSLMSWAEINAAEIQEARSSFDTTSAPPSPIKPVSNTRPACNTRAKSRLSSAEGS
jgi:DNA-binding HxlR family transcriptional regulator